MRDYTSFINDNVEEEPPFDPWEWQTQKPRVVQEDRKKNTSFASPQLRNSLQAIVGALGNGDEDVDEILSSLESSVLGLTGNQIGRVGSMNITPKLNDIADDVLRTAFDKVKNSVSQVDTKFNPGAYGKYFPGSKGVNINLESIAEMFPDEMRFASQVDNTALHEIFHNLDNTAIANQFGIGKSPDYLSGVLKREPDKNLAKKFGRKTEDFDKAFEHWRKRGILPEGLETRYGMSDIRFGDVPIEEVLATLFPNIVNRPELLPKTITKYVDFIRDLGGGR